METVTLPLDVYWKRQMYNVNVQYWYRTIQNEWLVVRDTEFLIFKKRRGKKCMQNKIINILNTIIAFIFHMYMYLFGVQLYLNNLKNHYAILQWEQ